MSTHLTHEPTREEVLAVSSRPVSRAPFLIAAALGVIGLIVFIAGVLIAPDRAWRALHFNWLYFTMISSAGVMFVAIQRITTARWSRPVIRFLEGFVAFLPVAFVLLVLIVVIGKGWIFPWTHETPHHHEKQVYLDETFFTVRVLAVFGLITLLSLWYVWSSVRLDVGVAPEWGSRWARGLRQSMRRSWGEERREIHGTHSFQGRLAVILALVWGFGWCFLAFDLSKMLDLHFFSTLYGWWFFMGGMLGAMMTFSMLMMWWRAQLGAQGLVLESHFHDVGKLCFAFTAFWGYLTFGQYLVIWYGNLPEETGFMRLRLIDPWKAITLTMVFLVFVLPFFGLLSRAAKVWFPTMILFAVLSLAGTWLLRYIEVYPSLYHQSVVAPFGIWELGVLALCLGLWGVSYFAFMNAFPRMRVTLMTSPYRDQVQVPYDPKTLDPLPAHE
ncbi:MAG TPA: hypothetical protein VMM18_17715 [Gemmatimonadaceae bacterium]|nr:hypothetical protein [Gemmatimonadaceae bacterium]